jgi:hypothetical protein
MRALAWVGWLALAAWQAAADSHSGMLMGYAELKKEGDDALLPLNVQSCGRTADAWLDRQLALPPPAPLANPDKLLYFLHIPRTAGACGGRGEGDEDLVRARAHTAAHRADDCMHGRNVTHALSSPSATRLHSRPTPGDRVQRDLPARPEGTVVAASPDHFIAQASPYEP